MLYRDYEGEKIINRLYDDVSESTTVAVND